MTLKRGTTLFVLLVAVSTASAQLLGGLVGGGTNEAGGGGGGGGHGNPKDRKDGGGSGSPMGDGGDRSLSAGSEDWRTGKNGKGSGFEKSQIKYLIRNRTGQSWKEMKNNGEVSKLWNPDGEVKFIIHGYSPRIGVDSMVIIRDQNILDIGLAYAMHSVDHNVIVVDWTFLATRHPSQYRESVSYVPKAGRLMADFLIALHRKGNLKSFKKVHIIGFSLGAHVAGNVGSNVQKDSEGSRIGRITGLDPMGPDFDEVGGKRYFNELLALTKQDAAFVDIVHCNMGIPTGWEDAQRRGRYGSAVQSGHADFYPNGGEQQPPCTVEDESMEKRCSHRRCPLIYARSIPNKYSACVCDDYSYYKSDKCDCVIGDPGQAFIGHHCRTNASGRFFLDLTL